MIVLLGESKEKNTELIRFTADMDLPCAYVSIYEKTSSCAYTPWNYYTKGGPDSLDEPLFWLDLKASPYWSFRAGDIRRGQIYNAEELLANVYFREPYEDQCIDRIEWIKNNETYSVDYYDESGSKYAEAVVNEGSESVVKYCDRNGTPMIISWTSTGFTAVKKERQEEYYESREQFLIAFMNDFISEHKDDTVFFYEPGLRKYIPKDSSCVLFVPDQVPEELADPGFRESLSLIVAGNPDSFCQIRQLFSEEEALEILECGSHIDRTARHPVGNALIVTRSQQIEQLQLLVEGLPELHFHIAAGTMMAPGLLEFDKYANVTLYPNSPRNNIMKLMSNCAFYLDVNHYLEYEGIVHAAQRMDRLVYAFENTVHQRMSIPEEHIFSQNKADQMISDISRAMFDPDWLQESLEIQRKRIEITDGQKARLKERLA